MAEHTAGRSEQRVTLGALSNAVWDIVPVFKALISSGARGGFGLREEELAKESGISGEALLKALSHLINQGVVATRLGQVGTAGPYAHWYNAVLPLDFDESAVVELVIARRGRP